MNFLHGWATRLAVAVILLVGVPSLAWGQASRTWVSGVGDDANPCSRTAPCKTFAGAISKTAAGGEISVLDPGGYGGVTITKSITINNTGGEAGVLVSGTNGIVVAAASTDRVTLRGLTVIGLGTGLSGIRINSAAEVVVENCQIEGFRGTTPAYGILVAPSSGWTRLAVRNTTINAGDQVTDASAGIGLVPSGSGVAIADISDVVLANNGTGLFVNASGTTGAAWANVRDSQIQGNAFNGVYVQSSSAATARATVKSSTVSDNGFTSGLTTVAGLKADGASAQLRFQDNVITVNKNGVLFTNGGNLMSYGGNIISANSANGSFSSTQSTQ